MSETGPINNPPPSRDSEKKTPPTTRDGSRGSKAAPVPASGKPIRKKEKAETGGGVENKRVPAKPAQVQDMMRERAEKLATLRHGRFDEFTWGSLGGLMASLPGAAHSSTEVSWGELLLMTRGQFVDFAVFLLFLSLTAAALCRDSNRGPTAMEYLEHHFGKDPDGFLREPKIIRLRRWFYRRWDELTRPL